MFKKNKSSLCIYTFLVISILSLFILSYHFISVPLDFQDILSNIHLQMAHKKFANYQMPPIDMVATSHFVKSLSAWSLPSFIVMILILFLGFQIVVINAILYSKTNQASLFHLGFFGILFSLYGLCTNSFVFFISQNTYIIYLGYFLLAALFPIPLLLYFKEVLNIRFCLLFNLLIEACLLNFVVQIVLHFTFTIDLQSMAVITQVLSLLTGLSFIIAYLLTPRTLCPQKHIVALQFAPLGIGAFIDYICYLFPRPHIANTFFFEVGVFIFLIGELITLAKYILKIYKQNLKLQFYRNIAYTDTLTSLANRLAFEKELNKFTEKPLLYESVWFMSIDLNNLKLANDRFGHQAGDTLIKYAATLFQEVFGPYGKIFRIGGDEFTVLVYNISEELLRDLVATLTNLANTPSVTLPVPLSFALGYTCFSPNGCDTITCALERADTLMYANKNALKNL